MSVSLAVTGPYPRRPNFAKVVSRFLGGKVSKQDYDRAVAKEIEYYITSMKDYGLDYFTAGLMRFDDPVDAMVSLLKNVAAVKNVDLPTLVLPTTPIRTPVGSNLPHFGLYPLLLPLSVLAATSSAHLREGLTCSLT